MNDTRAWASLAVGTVGGAVSAAFGGWSPLLTLLVGAMCVDYACGLIAAGVFHASNKSEGGALESGAGWRGLCRKFASLAVVWLGCRLDIYMGFSFIRDAVCLSYLCNEVLSIAENLGLMGVPMPPVVTKALDVLGARAQKDEKEGFKQ